MTIKYAQQVYHIGDWVEVVLDCFLLGSIGQVVSKSSSAVQVFFLKEGLTFPFSYSSSLRLATVPVDGHLPGNAHALQELPP